MKITLFNINFSFNVSLGDMPNVASIIDVGAIISLLTLKIRYNNAHSQIILVKYSNILYLA